MTDKPLVAVVTPFYNTAKYLGECIESVLAQTYCDFQYLLVDNLSTDGSSEIAVEYAKRDPRIRLLRNREFVGQVRNYNDSLRHIPPEARYVKVVQADDYIFPECLERMVAVAEAHPSVAIVSSYYLTGPHVFGSGIEWPIECVDGRAASRLHLLENFCLFGTPTTVLYRAELVSKRQPFYSETSLHEDTELCHEVLADADLGFVHQVLSFSRLGNDGILTAIDTFEWRRALFYTLVRRFGSRCLSEKELADRFAALRWDYRRLLAESLLIGREPEFWAYHRRALASIGERLPSKLALAPQIARAAIKAVVRPRWIQRERARYNRVNYRST
ncbi:MAG: glycosyltransferase family 2 protein [Gemmatimonadaceae bacterium]